MPANATDIRREYEAEGFIKAAKLIHREIEDIDQAKAALGVYGQRLLGAQKYAAASRYYWGDTNFSLAPSVSQMVFRALKQNAKVIIMGAGSCSKTYTGIGFTVLDWCADPENTQTKIISTTGGHVKSNAFGTIKMLHERAMVPLPGIARSEAIQYKMGDESSAISIIRIADGADSSGVLQGFHPKPRPNAHPVFGSHGRVRAVLDEAEEISPGVWSGIDNMQTGLSGVETVKIYAFYNPKDISSKLAQLAEPPTGWGDVDIETGYRGKNEWTSRFGWHVVRLDAAHTENVKQRKVVHFGLQTYEGFEALRQYNGGNSINYYVFARGIYPPEGANCIVVSQAIIKKMRGEFIFSGRSIKCGGLDTAIDGRDEAILTVGQYGLARGFRFPVGDSSWKTIYFTERWVLQIDQQLSIKKGSYEIVGEETIKKCKELGIDPAWLMIDATGNGIGLLGYLRAVWSKEVKGVQFGEVASEKKILEEDQDVASDRYDGVHSEVWFAFARWGESGFLCISPSVNSDSLESQLAGRRYKLGAGKLLRVEDKDIYKSRIGRSPDHADSATIILHLVRTAENVSASMTGKSNVEEVQDDMFPIEDHEQGGWLESGGV